MSGARDMPDSPGAGSDLDFDTARQRFADGLRLYVGQGRRFSLVALADASGIPHNTLKRYQGGDATPGIRHLLVLMRVLPPAFANHLLEMAWLTGARRIDGDASTAHGVLAGLSGTASDLAHMLEDGQLDHIERLALGPLLAERIAELSAFRAKLRDGAAGEP